MFFYGALFLNFLAFFYKSFFVLDPDLGWHLRLGEHILRFGIPKNDPLSYTMPTYRFIDHEWLTNILLFLIHKHVGFIGLALFFSIITTTALFFLFKNKTKNKEVIYGWFLFLIGSIFLSYVGIRPQVISWFFTAIFISILRKKGKILLLLPPLMILWANLHGGFFIGLVLIAIFITGDIVCCKTYKKLLLIFFITFLASFINPYGHLLWGEVWIQLSDTSLRWKIGEWMPAFLYFDIAYWGYITLSLALILKNKKKIYFTDILLYFIFGLAGIMSIRNIPLWIIVSVYPIKKAINLLFDEIKQFNNEGKRRLKIVLIWLRVILFILIIFQLTILFLSIDGFSEKIFYPQKALEYLKKVSPAGRVFTLYGWGGYYAWRNPDKKVFIDGRMPSWKRNTAPQGESRDAIGEYKLIILGKTPPRELKKKYGVDYILCSSDIIKKRIFSSPSECGLLKKSPQLRKIYSDNTATIYAII